MNQSLIEKIEGLNKKDNYPKALASDELTKKIYRPLKTYQLQFNKPAMQIFSETVETKVLEEAVRESPCK